jgi:rod shape-determining protein MreC
VLHLGRYRKFLAASIALVVLVTLMSVTARERERVLLVEKAVIEALAPVQAWFGGLTAGIRGTVADLQAIRHLREENNTLRTKAEAYDTAVHRLKELEIENERLRTLLGFAQAVEYEYVVADVISRNADNWFSRITINRGSSDGIAKNMPVVTSQGLVGRISEVSANISVVQLLTDRDSGAGALVQASRDAGIVSGQGSQSSLLSMMFFERTAEVTPEDTVVTSGFGEIFPPGLFVGRVVDVRKDSYGLVKYASIKPGVDFGRLEEVLVITNAAAGVSGR